MRLGIDASNVRSDGGVTHLAELLRVANLADHGFKDAVVWGGSDTLLRIEEQPGLVKSHSSMLDQKLPIRLLWQRKVLAKSAGLAGCNILLVPGGSHWGDFRPSVVMSQNLLPFEPTELHRYAGTPTGLRLMLLRWSQTRTFRNADGVIFLTKYAEDVVMRATGRTKGATTIIPHGVEPRFVRPPRPQADIGQYSFDRPYRILYVSIVDLYKHQWHAAEAVARLRQSGLPVALDLVGPANPGALARLRATMRRIDPGGASIRYSGSVPHSGIHTRYHEADCCLFASSCENMPNILLEGMASGLPVACSNRGPMPEILGEAGVYFNPEDPADIAAALGRLAADAPLRSRLAAASYRRSLGYSWKRCADETFEFLAQVAKQHGRGAGSQF